MPQIYRYLKLIFSFASDEHLPPHVHITDENENRSIFDLIIIDGVLVDIKVRKKSGYPSISQKNQGIVKSVIRIYYAQIIEKWVKYFILNKEVEIETIKKLDFVEIDTQKLVEEMKELNKHFYPGEKKQPKTKKRIISKTKKQ
jgi:hypothetical protein